MTANADKEKEKYCFRCGETLHRVKECPKQGDLKCKIHSNSKSHTELACFYYRKANNLPVSIRPRLDGSKEPPKSGPTPLPGNGSQNLVIAEINDDVDTTEINTDNESDEANVAQLSGE